MKYKIFTTYLFIAFLLLGLMAIQIKAAPGNLLKARLKLIRQFFHHEDVGFYN